MEAVSKTYCWGLCPAEILLIIFGYLDAKDLLACMGVSKMWRVNADYWGKKCGSWLQLVENGIQNKGSNFRQRSKLDFKELYLNCRMWYCVRKAQVKLKHVYKLGDVENMHIYRDSLIVLNQGSVKFFNVETGTMRKEICDEIFLDYQETDYLVAKFTLRQNLKHISLYCKQNNGTHEIFGIKLYKIQQNKCYIVNSRNMVEFYESTPKESEWRKLSRFYSSSSLLGALHIHEDDMYIYVIRGDVYSHRNGEIGIIKVCTLDVPMPAFDRSKEFFVTIFDKCSVVYGVQSKDKEKIIRNRDSSGEEHLVLLYSGLTCAMPHDDILLLGFEDGKVGIVLIKKLRTSNDLTPDFQFYIQDVANTVEVEAIKSLEVYEANSCHHLFIATRSNLFQVVISQGD